MNERVLTVRDLNRALLARQLLLERRSPAVPAPIERVGPLHAQGVESTYVNLWSRIEGFRREQLTRALERRAVVRGNLLRNTLHLRRFRDERGAAAAGRASRSAATAEAPAPPRFLLRWDNHYLGHASGERDRIVPPRWRRLVDTANTVMPPTFLVDGFAAGTWSHERRRVRIQPWRRLTRAERADVESESEQLADFLAG